MPAPGTQFGPYEILDQFSTVGRLTLYRAFDTHHQQQVTLELSEGDEPRSARLEREFHVLETIHHPNIPQPLDRGTIEGQPYIVVEQLSGETLEQYAAQHTISVREALEIGRQVAAGLSALHSAGFILGNLQLKNLIRTNDGTIKIIDLSFVGPPDPEFFRAASQYAAPEQLRRDRFTQTADIYSLGIVLSELLASRHRTTSDDLLEMIRARDTAPAMPLETPPPLESLLRACLNPDPVTRPSAVEVLARIDELLRAIDVNTSEPDGDVAPARLELPVVNSSELPTFEPSLSVPDIAVSARPTKNRMPEDDVQTVTLRRFRAHLYQVSVIAALLQVVIVILKTAFRSVPNSGGAAVLVWVAVADVLLIAVIGIAIGVAISTYLVEYRIRLRHELEQYES